MNNSSLCVFLSIASSFFYLSCKQDLNSKLKTLDQFAGGGKSYSCKGSFTDNARYLQFVRGIKNDRQKIAVENALSAIPTNIKERIFIGPVQSYVQITNNVATKCLGSAIINANSKQKSSIYACPVISNGEAIVFVDEDPKKIETSLVRGLAYYMTQVDSKIEFQLSSPSKMVVGFVDQGDITKSQKYLGALVFLDEVAAGGGAGVFSKLLPSAVLNATTKAERDAAFFDIRKTNASDRDAFVSYFLAEMMDSSFCSDETRKVLITKFPKTYAFFNPGENASGFALGSGGTVSSSANSGVDVSQARGQVSTRSGSDEPPIGMIDSKKMMQVVGSDGKETPTQLFYDQSGKTQTWKDPNTGVWKQSPIPKVDGPAEDVSVMAEAPMFAEAPPVSPLPRPTQQQPTFGGSPPSYPAPDSLTTNPATVHSVMPSAIITTGGSSLNTTTGYSTNIGSANNFNQPSVSGFQNGIVGSTYPQAQYVSTNSWLNGNGSGNVGSPSVSGTSGGMTSGSGISQPQSQASQSAWCRYLGWWCGGATSDAGASGRW